MTEQGKRVTPASGAAVEIEKAAKAKKCWPCGCLHSSIAEIAQGLSDVEDGGGLREALNLARSKLAAVEYDCFGCPVCYPANGVNLLQLEHQGCPTDIAKERDEWPPLPGNYHLLRADAPVAVCTLTGEELAAEILWRETAEISIVGTLFTENLGIERLIKNVIANPHIRRLVVCGPDSLQTIGHLPGQSMIALVKNGIDDRGRIIGAPGKRPILKNISRNDVEHFRKAVQVIDCVGQTSTSHILAAVVDNLPEVSMIPEAFAASPSIQPTIGYVPERMKSDPSGYFVIYPDRTKRKLFLEHYTNAGVMDAIIEGNNEAELYTPAIEKGLLSRLDHAAYLGKELARALSSLQSDTIYIQDSAPENPEKSCSDTSCGCH